MFKSLIHIVKLAYGTYSPENSSVPFLLPGFQELDQKRSLFFSVIQFRFILEYIYAQLNPILIFICDDTCWINAATKQTLAVETCWSICWKTKGSTSTLTFREYREFDHEEASLFLFLCYVSLIEQNIFYCKCLETVDSAPIWNMHVRTWQNSAV